jgi:hypothetical protein
MGRARQVGGQPQTILTQHPVVGPDTSIIQLVQVYWAGRKFRGYRPKCVLFSAIFA